MSLMALMVVTLSSLGGFPEEPTAPQPKPKYGIADPYRDPVNRIVAAALDSKESAYRRLEELCLTIGHRLSGSPGLERAIDWAVDTLKKDGHENVRKEKVMVPHWVRGNESARMIEPREQKLCMLGLGGSIATPPDGITAPVLVVKDKDDLDAKADQARGKIVLFNNPMPPYHPDTGSGYGKTVQYRTRGAIYAAEKGAVGCLVRSVTARSLCTPHTGAMRYDENVPKIPAAAITVEDADTIARLSDRGIPVVVNLKMEAQTLPDAESANVIAELRGREKPEEIVVIGGHIDAWDVGHGAHDDATGCVMAMEALTLLRKLNMIPRRTIRVVLWTNEENGLAGGKAYAKDHEGELGNHVAAIESDSGGFKPVGYSVECADAGREALAALQMDELLSLVRSIGPMNMRTGWSGADISPMKESGVLLMGHNVEGSTYFDLHHSPADTIDKVDPREFAENVAVMASVAYVLADMPGRIGVSAADAAEDRPTK